MTLFRAFQLKNKHPLWTWRQCLSYALEDARGEVPWTDICIGIAFVMVCAMLAAQVIHRLEQDDWVCTRASQGGVWIAGKLESATPCTEETNVNTGKTRVTKWGTG